MPLAYKISQKAGVDRVPMVQPTFAWEPLTIEDFYWTPEPDSSARVLSLKLEQALGGP